VQFCLIENCVHIQGVHFIIMRSGYLTRKLRGPQAIINCLTCLETNISLINSTEDSIFQEANQELSQINFVAAC
jgi:hypothetical protein